MIINEAQRVPELFNAIQVVSDERGTVGQYILLGSQNYLLLRRITQSLAGRIGLVRLMPLSYREVALVSSEVTPDGFMLRGGYPRLYDVDIPSYVYFENYISTYVERDVSEYADARSKRPFRRLLMLCAQSCGSLLNVSRLASDYRLMAFDTRGKLHHLQATAVSCQPQEVSYKNAQGLLL